MESEDQLTATEEEDNSTTSEDQLEEQLEHLIHELEQIQSNPIEELIVASMVCSFHEASYLETGTFSSQPFRVRPGIAKQFAKESIVLQERYTLSEYVQLLTSYVVKHKCITKEGIITPTPFLRSIFGVADPCTILHFLKLAKTILV